MCPEYIIRTAFSVDFLDAITAKAWGIDFTRRIVWELKLSGPHYMDINGVPTFKLYQSDDVNLSPEKLKDVASFGLEWQLRNRFFRIKLTKDWRDG
jgi:hypothetical protein